jgi:hypothetical protein
MPKFSREFLHLEAFCEINYYLPYRAWVDRYNEGEELATQCIIEEEDGLYIDQSYFEEWMKDYIELIGYSREVAEQYVKKTYQLDSSKWLEEQEITGEVVDVWKAKTSRRIKEAIEFLTEYGYKVIKD